MSIANRHIIDIYHAHAQPNAYDGWSRRHIHGLNRSYLKTHGFSNQKALVSNFKEWLRHQNVIAMYANAPAKEARLLNNANILDLRLPNWSEREYLMSHRTARDFKMKALPITSVKGFKSCPSEVHSEFEKIHRPLPQHLSLTDLAKKRYGYHCSLYDVYALYLHYVTDN